VAGIADDVHDTTALFLPLHDPNNHDSNKESSNGTKLNRQKPASLRRLPHGQILHGLVQQ
jgi:hypothetical protein